MPISHVYSLLHNQPASSSMMLNRYLGIEGPSDAPFMLHNLSPPIPDRRGSSHATSDLSPEGYIRLDPTRPNPHMYYLCQWLGCFSRVRGASTGLIQYHLRRVHQVNDSINQHVRCEYLISCEEDRICGAEVLVKDLGSHVCDIHWRSRAVQCPFCGAFQTHRGDCAGALGQVVLGIRKCI
ncbi:hypothetical protein F5887DRAFT_272711 [Amanita rubescens]|nr:hypothetical protein F5887DRAFT_272711 [Amanita rubescens]